MADLTYIANQALDLVGQAQIASLNDATPAAKKCNLHIYEAIRDVLRGAKFKCSKKKAVLAQITAAPAFGYSLQYQLPGDYLRVVRFNDVDPDDVRRPLYDIQGTKLLTDETTANLDYICDLTANGNDLGAAPADVVYLFSLKLAVRLSWSFSSSGTRQEQLKQELMIETRKALARDAQETRQSLVNNLSESSWIQRRLTSTNN